MIPTAPFGRTGHDSTRVIFGAAALGGMSQERADATLEEISAWGINHIIMATKITGIMGCDVAPIGWIHCPW